jgi:hypothetical protein
LRTLFSFTVTTNEAEMVRRSTFLWRHFGYLGKQPKILAAEYYVLGVRVPVSGTVRSCLRLPGVRLGDPLEGKTPRLRRARLKISIAQKARVYPN